MSLLEAFEKLLASLIILAILVLIMFLAFDNDRVVSTPGSERFDARYEEPPAAPAAPREVAKQEAAPPPATPAPAPAPAPQAQNGQPVPGNGKVPVPDPGAPPASPAPVTPPRQDMAKAPETEAPKQAPEAKEPGKKFYAALRKDKEPVQQSVAETKSARHEPHLKRTSAERIPPPATKRARRDDGTVHRTEYKKHTRTEYRDRWDRNHYYECTGGQCSCDCNRPYWSQSDVCAD